MTTIELLEESLNDLQLKIIQLDNQKRTRPPRNKFDYTVIS